MIVLICGLPGTGKTTFAKGMMRRFGDRAVHINGDEMRQKYNDWDFSEDGRRRQAERMRDAAAKANADGKIAVLDFVCPKEEYRKIINPYCLIYMNTTPVREFADTTAMFEPPKYPHLLVQRYDQYNPQNVAFGLLESQFDYTAPTGLMIGRYQPFHDGHKALFLEILKKHGQVFIAVRDMPRSENNPYSYAEIRNMIYEKLDAYIGKFEVFLIPNVVDVLHGRDVGWTVSHVKLPEEIEAISATEIRKNKS